MLPLSNLCKSTFVALVVDCKTIYQSILSYFMTWKYWYIQACIFIFIDMKLSDVMLSLPQILDVLIRPLLYVSRSSFKALVSTQRILAYCNMTSYLNKTRVYCIYGWALIKVHVTVFKLWNQPPSQCRNLYCTPNNLLSGAYHLLKWGHITPVEDLYLLTPCACLHGLVPPWANPTSKR